MVFQEAVKIFELVYSGSRHAPRSLNQPPPLRFLERTQRMGCSRAMQCGTVRSGITTTETDIYLLDPPRQVSGPGRPNLKQMGRQG